MAFILQAYGEQEELIKLNTATILAGLALEEGWPVHAYYNHLRTTGIVLKQAQQRLAIVRSKCPSIVAKAGHMANLFSTQTERCEVL